MTSVISSRSNVALLVHTLSKTSSNERSYSKRLYTFFHYEHSTHPRRWIILFFLILFISISLAWIVAGLIRFRTTASYLESCSQGKVQCASGTFLICSLSSSVCLCPERMFWDENKRKCLTVKSINQSCSTHQQCDTDQNLICQTNSRTCQCPPNSYYHLSSCTPYLMYDAPCSTSNTSLCNIQLGLTCDTSLQKCVCPPSTYWSSARCESLATYADYCDQNRTCDTQRGLFCRLPGPYAACDCPLLSKFYTCDCSFGQTWLPATNINATSTCVNQLPYLGNCTTDNQCSPNSGLSCINGTCDCTLPLWFRSHTTNQCLPCESQGYILIRYSSQWVCTRLINSSLLTYSASRSACTSLGWSLISPIVALDIPAIARVYPTYRLWMDIQTSLGNSTYINNLFPNNQSNWNTYVLNSFTADYFSYTYALQIIASYNQTMLFEGNTNINTGHALCIIY